MGERTWLDVVGDSIVNPKCDDCGHSMSTPKPDQIGMPRQCGHCRQIADAVFEARYRDWNSQERPRGRTIHKVKLWGTGGGN